MEGLLSPYRVLDLTDEKGLICGKILGDMGADVIKIEKPGGDPARRIGPFYHDEIDPEKSLYWFAYNNSKRGMTLDIESAEGQEIFKQLVKTADFVIESFEPGYMAKLGLGYEDLDKLNPGIILVSISPFGQTGPLKDYKASDITLWALGGMMYVSGDQETPPVRISHHPQSYLHGAAEGAAGAMMALYYRQITGKGQHVDVSIQESVVQVTDTVTLAWDMQKATTTRSGPAGANPKIKTRSTRTWPCKDGYVRFSYRAGPQAERNNAPLIEWMDSEGFANDFLRSFNWATWDMRTTTQEVIDQLEQPTKVFFLAHTKLGILKGALKYRLMMYPASTPKDILESEQLAVRDFWVKVEHPELGTTITYPGAMAKTTLLPPRISRRAPLIGEHNDEIRNELARGTPARKSKTQRTSLPQGSKVFDGIKVLDFTWFIAGPQLSKMLADYGAEVIKIEGMKRPDPHRPAGPYKDDIQGPNRSGLYNQYNTSKLGISLNLTNPKGVEIARQLVARADIVLENFAGGVINRLGLGYEEIKKIKPDIIMLSSCMQGQTGPYANHPGTGSHLEALSGFTNITGWPGREPANLMVYTDYIAPRLSCALLMAALDYKRRTGKGQYIDVSQLEDSVQFITPLLLDYSVNGRVAQRLGNRYPYAAPHNAYPCQGHDKWCAIAVFSDEDWKNFCSAVGNPSWTKDKKFGNLASRKANEEELDRLVGDWTINHSNYEVMELMQKNEVDAGVVATGQDLLENDTQLRHRKFFWELPHAEIGSYRAHRPAFLLSRSPCELKSAPLLGEHTEQVLKQILGMTDDEIAELAIAGVFE